MNHIDSKVIDSLGGTKSVSGMCAVKSQAVSKWRKEGIPPARLMYLKLLRPDVFADTIRSTGKQAA